MKTVEKKIPVIEKENIPNLTFSRREVLSKPEAIKQRMYDLYRSQILGNISQGKVWITFETSDSSLYKVNTTIWAVGEKFINLKRGIVVPINAIHQID
ncbi:hypothetical protein [Negadavirga shengliensis]|uniref:YolD-like protein n=1 Tax=Negadavirga shengliensis TaxID=1389218 RepID=A0ABV9T4G6_9BACT